MSRHGAVLLLLLVLASCGKKPTAPLRLPRLTPAARRLNSSYLQVQCAHVVVAPDLIRGVLTARNLSKEPLAFVERWNSWGAYQWTLKSTGWSAWNPQTDWDQNFYTETVLAPGEVRHVRFCITASSSTPRVPEDDWWFDAEVPMIWSSLSTPPASQRTAATFASGQSLRVTMDGTKAETVVSDPNFADPLWVGVSTAGSEELSSVSELESRLQGKKLR